MSMALFLMAGSEMHCGLYSGVVPWVLAGVFFSVSVICLACLWYVSMFTMESLLMFFIACFQIIHLFLFLQQSTKECEAKRRGQNLYVTER